jgi:hypothetical protein
MKLGGLILLYENKEIIVTIIVLSIMFFIYWDKRSLPLDDKKTNDFNAKWYDVSQMDRDRKINCVNPPLIPKSLSIF